MSDLNTSDDERYANDTFESDTDVPEVPEIESEISEDSGDDESSRISSVKRNLNTGPIRRPPPSSYKVPQRGTDAVPFDSSSEEEDDVVMGQTMAQINTPSMHFLQEPTGNKPNRKQIVPPSDVGESSAYGDSDEEREFQRIKAMEERYMQQNPAKTPKSSGSSRNSPQRPSPTPKKELDLSDDQVEVETTAIAYKTVVKKRSQESDANGAQSLDPIPEMVERVMQQFTPNPQQMENNLIEMIQQSLTNLLSTSSSNTDNESPSKLSLHKGESPKGINADDIAMALVKAISMTQLEVKQTVTGAAAVGGNTDESSAEEIAAAGTTECSGTESQNTLVPEGKQEECEQEAHAAMSQDDNYETESFYGTQYEYEIESKTPSCYRSQDFLFHANMIKPTPSSDRLRPRPQPRKSMTFSNERMREIERHNQILLKKILTQKPTYVARINPPSAQYSRSLQQRSNDRQTSAALNRKKQQRQIDIDNQVLKRKLEAISMRRRPLLS